MTDAPATTTQPAKAEPDPATVKDPKQVGTDETARKAPKPRAKRVVRTRRTTDEVYRVRLGPDPVLPEPGPVNRADPRYRAYYEPFNELRNFPNFQLPLPAREPIAGELFSKVDPAPPPVVPNALIYQGPQGQVWASRPLGIDDAPIDEDVTKACSDARALADIVHRFNWVQAETWGTAVRMVGIANIRLVKLKNDGVENERYTFVPKRYCRGEAVLNNGQRQKLAYLISEEGGFTGLYSGTTFCVAGYDYFRQHEPACRVLNPY